MAAHWTPEFDISTVPDKVFYSEVARRRVAKRKKAGTNGGADRKPGPRCASWCDKHHAEYAEQWKLRCAPSRGIEQ